MTNLHKPWHWVIFTEHVSDFLEQTRTGYIWTERDPKIFAQTRAMKYLHRPVQWNICTDQDKMYLNSSGKCSFSCAFLNVNMFYATEVIFILDNILPCQKQADLVRLSQALCKTNWQIKWLMLVPRDKSRVINLSRRLVFKTSLENQKTCSV